MDDTTLTRMTLTSDQAIYHRGLSALLRSIPGVALIGEAQTAAETLELVAMVQPDSVLLDLRTPLEQRMTLAAQVCRGWPDTRMIILHNPGEEARSDEAGCCPLFIARDVSEEEFKAAVAEIQRNPGREGASQWRHVPDEDEQAGEAAVLPEMPQARNPQILARELAMAGKMQADILPENTPTIPGWEIAARLEPAWETSGDFYDFIPLTENKWGVVVADVADKGMGSALFMVLCSTLLRTYAARFPTMPAFSLNVVNERILTDTHGGTFVTAFFGVLEPHTGRMVYANAGHPPGYIINTQKRKENIEQLRPTGMALGVSEQSGWKQKNLRICPGDYLLLYTDGITESQNWRGEFFGADRLLETALANPNAPALVMRDAILTKVHNFSGNIPRQDDIALIVIRRNPED